MFKIINEEDEVEYENEDDLSYYDDDNDFCGRDCVAVFNKGNYVGDFVVWLDSEMGQREYILINYNLFYLDTMKNN